MGVSGSGIRFLGVLRGNMAWGTLGLQGLNRALGLRAPGNASVQGFSLRVTPNVALYPEPTSC